MLVGAKERKVKQIERERERVEERKKSQWERKAERECG